MTTLPKELKEAIAALSHTEKDKLLFRLLKKDPKLIDRLFFELVEGSPVDEKREQIRIEIEEFIERFSYYFDNAMEVFFTLRTLGGTVTEYVFITKDKYGEVALSWFILKKILENANSQLQNLSFQKTEKTYLAIISKVFKTLLLQQKLHEDLQMDFSEDVRAIAQQFGSNPTLMKLSIQNGLDVNWLFHNEIPTELPALYKNLRQNGFLRPQ